MSDALVREERRPLSLSGCRGEHDERLPEKKASLSRLWREHARGVRKERASSRVREGGGGNGLANVEANVGTPEI